ncbi:DEHA2C02288p [Debaryomyces hansenii CBS767]|uniref:NAD(P)H-hydrate epimerase n=1 Tax=Debaryomyces hansenii (strain ATCC 36239 / CBS 767 / BCRC 21394 / JCM 1990 / NBRC 0083 / IGC 2968) TaxID=284592 RepID=Q6BVI9_DEBHA|nr:DEHA2C02288p [Debaryomyces hansenii CBS767]CAG85818.1 DEHA2C02288p [Debaryomyces hansenii CBS767]|eukprot:XP_457780.1 DEHA2C02288p [Debaryomyces hansenii CBS767]
MFRNTFKTLSSKMASQLDQELMSTGAFSIDQLMELAGLSVAQAIYRQYPPTSASSNKVLMLVGPGNNGGDGLVASRHLKIWGYDPVLFYPKKSTKNELYKNLLKQLQDLEIPEIENLEEIKSLLETPKSVKIIVDSLFGFSFKPPIRAPFDDLINYLSTNHSKIPDIVSVDIPSGWDVDKGPVDVDINSTMLISLTAPKPCSEHFLKEGRVHYLGGRFINQKIAQKYDIEDLVKLYKGDELIVKL